jgi:hypothetical protein
MDNNWMIDGVQVDEDVTDFLRSNVPAVEGMAGKVAPPVARLGHLWGSKECDIAGECSTKCLGRGQRASYTDSDGSPASPPEQ